MLKLLQSQTSTVVSVQKYTDIVTGIKNETTGERAIPAVKYATKKKGYRLITSPELGIVDALFIPRKGKLMQFKFH